MDSKELFIQLVLQEMRYFIKKAYKSVLDVPKPIDLAVIVIKNTLVAPVIEECGKKKIKGVIIITAGFKEVDEEGAKREQEIKDIAKKIQGPNHWTKLSWCHES